MRQVTNADYAIDRWHDKEVARLKAQGIMPPDIGFPNWFAKWKRGESTA